MINIHEKPKCKEEGKEWKCRPCNEADACNNGGMGGGGEGWAKNNYAKYQKRLIRPIDQQECPAGGGPPFTLSLGLKSDYIFSLDGASPRKWIPPFPLVEHTRWAPGSTSRTRESPLRLLPPFPSSKLKISVPDSLRVRIFFAAVVLDMLIWQ